MATHVSPGVYFNEISLDLYAPQLSTTFLAVVGTSPKGPVNTPTFISNIGAFTNKFGSPAPDHLAMYAATQFLKYGTQMWFIRVNGPDASLATTTLKGVATNASMLGTNRESFSTLPATEPLASGFNNDTEVTITSSNKNLLFQFNGGTIVPVVLTEGEDIDKNDVIDEINAAIEPFGGLAYVNNNHLVFIKLENSFGSTAKLELLETINSGYAVLGLTPDTYYGTDSNVTIRFTSLNRSTGSDVTAHLDVTVPSTSSATSSEIATSLNSAFTTGSFPLTASVVDGRIKITHNSLGQFYGFKVSTVNNSNLPYIKGLATVLGFEENTYTYGRGHSPVADTLTINAASVGTWGNDLRVMIANGSIANTFKITVVYRGTVVEIFDNLVMRPEDADLGNKIKYIEDAINGIDTKAISEYIRVTDIISDDGYPLTGTYTLSGGDDGLESISDEDYIGTVNGDIRTGLQTIANSELYDVNLIIVPGISSAPVINEVISVCRSRGDCMAIIDPPLGLGVQQVVDWHNGVGVYSDHAAFNDSYGALYWPWCKVYDPYNEQYIWTPPSGHLAGVYAFNDSQRDVWWAPAGYNRGLLPSVQELEFNADQGSRDFLYGNQNAVNPITKSTKDGIAVWGQRTLQRKPTALDRVNVRRLILYIRKVLATTVKYFVFEPNDSFTWRQFIGLTEPFLETIKDRRGLYEYKVICDATTNPPSQIDQNEMVANIYLKPTKAAEAITVNLITTDTGTSFDEIIK